MAALVTFVGRELSARAADARLLKRMRSDPLLQLLNAPATQGADDRPACKGDSFDGLLVRRDLELHHDAAVELQQLRDWARELGWTPATPMSPPDIGLLKKQMPDGEVRAIVGRDGLSDLFVELSAPNRERCSPF